MRQRKFNSRKEKVNYINSIREGKVAVIPPIIDMIVICNDEYLSMRTGKQWTREEYIREHGEDVRGNNP